MKKWLYTLVMGVLLLCSANISFAINSPLKLEKDRCKQADLVIFSYDRPLQLYAFLESLEKYVTGIASKQVIYRVSHTDFDKGYQIVKNRFPKVRFFKQGPKAPHDFKPLLLHTAFDNGTTEYLMLGVDDLIMTDYVDVDKCIQALEANGVTGFFLRLGKNITQNYTINLTFDLPKLTDVGQSMCTWEHAKSKGDWSLAASTDMTIYRKKDVKEMFEDLFYYNPNNFEAQWIAAKGTAGKGICFSESKVINIPYNIVQDNKKHRNMNFLSPRELLDVFLAGSKIDITSVSNKKNGGPINKAPHMEFITPFIQRRFKK